MKDKLISWVKEIQQLKLKIASATQGDDAWLRVNLMEVRQLMGELAFRIEEEARELSE